MKTIDDLHVQVKELRDDLKRHVSKASNPKEAVLCEVACETVGGLEEAFDHYLNKSEEVWK